MERLRAFLEAVGCVAHITDNGLKVTIQSHKLSFAFNINDFGAYIIERMSVGEGQVHFTLIKHTTGGEKE